MDQLLWLRCTAWKNVAVINDINSSKFGESGGVVEICGDVVVELTNVLPEINFLLMKTDKTPNVWVSALRQAQTYSRSKKGLTKYVQKKSKVVQVNFSV